jgi:hypothetical protein
MRSGTAVAVLLLGVVAAGCELAEVVTVEADDVLVVEAVLRAGVPGQRILLHRPVAAGRVPGERGAEVLVHPEEGRSVRFREAPMDDCVGFDRDAGDDRIDVIEPTCYLAEGAVPEVGSGYRLEVVSSAGERLEGETVVPGAFDWRAPALPEGAPRRCVLPAGESLALAWSRSEGAWAYIGELEIEGLEEVLAERGIDVDVPSPLRLTGLAISESDTTLTLPRDFGLFQRGSIPLEVLLALQQGLPEGTSARLVLAAADRNYVNSVRGGAFNPSGTVRVPSVRGDGTGVFASLVPLALEIATEGEGPSCLP